MKKLARLCALEAKATPAPWTPSVDEPGDVVIWGPTEEWMANIGNWARQHPEIDAKAAARQFCELRDAADAELIAAMRDTILELTEIASAAWLYRESVKAKRILDPGHNDFEAHGPEDHDRLAALAAMKRERGEAMFALLEKLAE